jgi:hypothetical protein
LAAVERARRAGVRDGARRGDGAGRREDRRDEDGDVRGIEAAFGAG